jgi:tripartite-type tricarboxylate transporter receptor subunit TctC
MRHAIAFGVLAWMLAIGAPVAAQSYPDHAVKIVVPSAPAGGYDILGRIVADQLTRRFGQSFVVENRPGAGTIVGTKLVVSAAPDGYTLLVGGLSNIIFNAGLYKNSPYDPLNDLVPVALIMNTSYSLVGSNSLPHGSVAEIVAAAKRNPGSIRLANAGIGTGQHVVGAALQIATGTKFLEVPYRGSTLVYPDLLPGRVDLFVDATAAALPYVKSGQVKGLAILTAKRHPDAPQMPTLTEAGVKGFEIDSWIGIFAPAKTPSAIIARLRQEIAASGPEMLPRIAKAGGELMDLPPEKTSVMIKTHYDMWIKAIKDAGIALD